MLKKTLAETGCLLLASILSWGPLAQAQQGGVVLTSKYVEGKLSLDPEAAAWANAPVLAIPLSSQVNFKPRIYNATAKKLEVRSLNNGAEIAFLLEWQDPTRDTRDLRAERFADRASIQFPIAPWTTKTLRSLSLFESNSAKSKKIAQIGKDTVLNIVADDQDGWARVQPPEGGAGGWVESSGLGAKKDAKSWFCMGMPSSVVYLWLWNAGWQEDLKRFQDVEAEYPGGGWDSYPFQEEKTFYAGRAADGLFSGPVRKTPVEDLNAARMQTLTAQPPEAQNVQGRGIWKGGKWRVVFLRSMTSQDGNMDAQFQPTARVGRFRPIAFAVWDGGNGERGSQKAVSAFYFLEIASATSPVNYAIALGALLLTLGVEVGLVKIVRPRLRRRKGSAA